MNNRGWETVFALSFIPLGLWIVFLLVKFGMNLSAFPWILFVIPAVPYMGFQVCLAILAFSGRIRGEAKKSRFSIVEFVMVIIRKPAVKNCVNSIRLGVKMLRDYLPIEPYLAKLTWHRRL